MERTATHATGVSDAAVAARTGKTWDEWFTLLDAAGGATLCHRAIVAVLHRRLGLSDGWWAQMVTVGYEQARGLRQKHERPGGFQISGSVTVNVPMATLYAAWTDAAVRARWLGDAQLTIRKATPARSLRITWADGSDVNPLFYAQGPAKSQVSLQHGKLPDAAAAADQKAWWKARLAALKALLEAPGS